MQADGALGAVQRYFRDGYYSTSPAIDGWGPWQTVAGESDTDRTVTAEFTNSLVFVDLATVGPQVTVLVPPSGRVAVTLSASIRDGMMAAEWFGGAAESQYSLLSALPNELKMSYRHVFAGLTPGLTTFTAKYRAYATSATFSYRELTVEPL